MRVAPATIALDDDPAFVMNELYYVDKTGGAILTVFTPGDAEAEYDELIAYIRQSLRTVPGACDTSDIIAWQRAQPDMALLIQ